MDLFDVGSAERVASELDRLVEKRARDARHSARLEEIDSESVRLRRARQRESLREAWRAYHLAQAERLERTAAELARGHRARAEDLLGESGGASEGAAVT